MLKTYLTTLPYTKFILIEDSLNDKGTDLFDYVVKCQARRDSAKLHFLVYEGIFSRVKLKYAGTNIKFYDFVSNNLNWTKSCQGSLSDISANVKDNDVVVLDSLAHAILLLGVGEIYSFLNSLVNNFGVQQIATLLHKDLLLDKEVRSFCEHLCTLSIRIKPKFYTENRRAKYRYKKVGGKIITQVEEYKFENGNLVTVKIEKPDSKKIENVIKNSVNPENLSTFRIGLSDAEKESKENVVLPYLPKDCQEGKITYTMEDIDDWDEEDPDDDLDI